MVRSLLADRFKLAAHFETHDVPVLAVTLARAGKLGPKLIAHAVGALAATRLHPALYRPAYSAATKAPVLKTFLPCAIRSY
jgi:uncharacterized protein (TIGR03435 family)